MTNATNLAHFPSRSAQRTASLSPPPRSLPSSIPHDSAAAAHDCASSAPGPRPKGQAGLCARGGAPGADGGEDVFVDIELGGGGEGARPDGPRIQVPVEFGAGGAGPRPDRAGGPAGLIGARVRALASASLESGGAGVDRTLHMTGTALDAVGGALAVLGAVVAVAVGQRFGGRMDSTFDSGEVIVAPKDGPLRQPIVINMTGPATLEATFPVGFSARDLLGHARAVAWAPMVTGLALCVAGRSLRALADRRQASRIVGAPGEPDAPATTAAALRTLGTALTVAGAGAAILSTVAPSLAFEHPVEAQLKASGRADLDVFGQIDADTRSAFGGPFRAQGNFAPEGLAGLSAPATRAVSAVILALGLGLLGLSSHLEQAATGRRLERARDLPR